MAVRQTTRLTKARIEKFPAPDPSGKPRLHWDVDLRGFGVLCSGKSTAKSFVVQVENPAKIPRRTMDRLDRMPRDYSLDEVREKAKDWLRQLAQGIDPQGKKAAGAIRTLSDALASYLELRNGLRPATVRNYERTVSLYFADWQDRPLRALSREMIEARHREITAGVPAGRYTKARHGKAVDGHATANGAIRVLRLLYNHAIDRDDSLGRNPVRLARGQWHRSKRRTGIVKTTELPAFWEALNNLENPIHRDYIKLVLLTGLRRREATGLTWAEIDFAEKMIRLPGSRTKTHEALDLPMSDLAFGILVARRAIGFDGPFVFSSGSKTGHLEEPRFALGRVADATGIQVTVHDLRRTYISVAESCQISLFYIKKLVNHSTGDVTLGYVVMEADQLREAAQLVADRFKLLIGIEPPAAENVIPISQ
ncbi:MAG: integrase family protein [Proteobacteria bacterium]|nr:integrase family protein [Pseudomonadota bacterium]